MDSLVSTGWLAEHLGEKGLTVLDASWFMPSSGRSAREEFLRAHIAGAQFLDIDGLSDQSNPAPHMLPSAANFGSAMEHLGVGSEDRIIVYDNSPIRTAARGWFMLRHFGARHVAILDGGLQKWTAEGRETRSGEEPVSPARFTSVERGDIAAKEQLLPDERPVWVDARGKPRFEGSEPDPRPGVAAGHAPGARNLPFVSLYCEDGTLRSIVELKHLFANAGVDPMKPFVASCGSGVTANSLIFAAHLIGNDDTQLYDGSWSEWGSDPATPKILGPA